MSRMARISAPAKVNLRLRVLTRRPDGYHEIDTFFQAIDLTDEVTVRLGASGIRLDVSGFDVGPSEENLAYRAAQRFAARIGLREGVDIELVKRIPAGAGLGGGSSDAAAVLIGLAALEGVPMDDPRLGQAATELGSDVPFFLGSSSLARGRGRGERLDPLEPLPAADLVLVSPPVHVSTAGAYAALAASRRQLEQDEDPVPEPRSWSDVVAHARNDFQPVVTRAHPEVSRAIGALEGSGATLVLMSGSGSSVFGVFTDAVAARAAADSLGGALGWPCRAQRTLTRMSVPILT